MPVAISGSSGCGSRGGGGGSRTVQVCSVGNVTLPVSATVEAETGTAQSKPAHGARVAATVGGGVKVDLNAGAKSMPRFFD